MVSNEYLDTEDVIGRRIESGGFFGTVHYVGPLPNHPGIWYGIEWDDNTRGKNNGTVNGIQYFQTRHPTSGSFIKREKINFGRSLVDAIVSRYNGEDYDTAKKKIIEQQIVNFQKQINAPFIDFVGFDKIRNKQSNFESLSIVCVRSQNVSVIGELRCAFQNIREIDLSKNLLNSWSDIFNVCSQLTNLYCLNVSENRLSFPSELSVEVFPNITVLICGNMNLQWNDVKKLSKIFPNINELRVNNNDIKDLTTPMDHNFNNLEVLDLEGNELINWREIIKLNVIKRLQNLSLNQTYLEEIDFECAAQKVEYFFNLNKLFICSNNINNWKSISELNKLPNLEELKFLHNPVVGIMDDKTVVSIVIAKIASLKVYNGGRITRAGRRDAELDYLKKYGLEWLRVRNIPEERNKFLLEHNRYLELIGLYGELEEDSLKVPSSILKHNLISVKLIYEGREINKKISPTMLLQKLKLMVQKLFKLDGIPELICSDENGTFEILLDDNTREINYFSLKNDDIIIVKEST